MFLLSLIKRGLMTTADNHLQESDNHEDLAARLDNLEAKVDSGFERQDARTDALEVKVDSGFERVDAKIDALKAEVDGGFERVDANAARLEAKVDDGFERMDARADRADARVDRLEGWISGMRGQEYERHCRDTVGPAMVRYLRRANISNPTHIAEQLSDAFENGVIDQRQYHSASVTDIVGRGYCRQRQKIVQIAAEASIRLNRRDIDRARERADILNTVTGSDHVAYCITHREWSAHLESYAESQEVTLVHYHWDGLTEFSEVETELDE